MNLLRIFIIGLLPLGPLAAQVSCIDQTSEIVTIGSEMFLRWFGHGGRTYFLQVSDPSDHLRKWTWAPVIKGGNNEVISHKIDSVADKGFFRLRYADQVPDLNETLESADFDDDGFSNWDEITTHFTDPLNPDSDGDGSWDGDEGDAGTDPKDPSETPQSGWFILTGDLPEYQPKKLNRTVTISPGQSRVIVVLVASREYPGYTGDPSEANDTLSWNIQPAGLDGLGGGIDVNSRHGAWLAAAQEGRAFRGFNPVHIEAGITVTAPDNEALEIGIDLTATNIGVEPLPSTVLVGVLPVVPVEFFPQLPGGDGNAIAGSENARTAPGQTNGMVEEDPVANRIAHREIRMRIVDGAVLAGRQITWSMTPLFVPPAGGAPVFRGNWANSTTHPDRYETAVQFGTKGFEAVDQATAHTYIDENGESAIRANLAPVGFNKGRLWLEVEEFDGNPAKVGDMEVPAVVVIDPGHGGVDSGNQAGGYDEKDLTLDYAQATMNQLVVWFAERQPFHRIIITRNADVALASINRPQIARDEGADAFISIHFNDGATTARGVETLIRGEDNVNLGQDQALAERIQFAAVAAVGFTRTPGVKSYSPSDPSLPSRWTVLRDDLEAFSNTIEFHPIRGCIQEVDFISNPTALDAITNATNGPILRANYASMVSAAIIEDMENQP